MRFLVILFDSSLSESDIMINEGFQKYMTAEMQCMNGGMKINESIFCWSFP